MNDYEKKVELEMEAYQSALDSGHASDSFQDSKDTDLPSDVLQRLTHNRECLDFLHQIKQILHSDETQPDLPDEEFPLPDRIGRFLVKQHLGSGGFGIVFRATDEDDGRDVAIKIPRPEILVSPNLIERFRREAKAVALLDHPNILSVYESDEEGVTPFIVMPYVDGKNLAEWQHETLNIPPKTAASILYQVTIGVAHAHNRGVLHRDLKPANILLDPQQNKVENAELPFTPKLMDFGLAKLVDYDQNKTRTGALLGTTSYMAPEQAEGRNKDISAMSDIFSLGVILYELLTGVHPFRGKTPIQTMDKILRSDPPPFKNIHHKIPVDLQAICLKCLEKNPEKRYQSASDLAKDLQRFLTGKPVHAQSITQWKRLTKWCRRHPVSSAVTVVTCLSLLLIMAISLSYNSKLTSLLHIAEVERNTVREQALIIRRSSCVSDVRLAQITWNQGNPAQAISLLKRHVPQSGEEDVRDFAWWQLWRDYKESSIVLGRHKGGANSVTVTSDGLMAASGGEDSMIRLWSIPSRKMIAKLKGHDFGAVNSVQFSPDGAQLVSGGEDHSVRIWKIDSKKEVLNELSVIKGHKDEVLDVAYSPDGKQIASAGNDLVIRVWNPDTGKLLGELKGHTKPVCKLAFHPVEQLLASTAKDGTIRFWNLNEFGPDHRISNGMIQVPKPENWCRSLTFSPSGTSLAGGSIMNDIFEWSWKQKEYGILIHSEVEFPNARSLYWPKESTFYKGGVTGDIYEYRQSKRVQEGRVWNRSIRKSHSSAVNSIVMSENRQFMLSASKDETIRLWKSRSYPEHLPEQPSIASKSNERDRIWEVNWSPKYLVTKTEALRLIGKQNERTSDKGRLDFYLNPEGEHFRSVLLEKEEEHAVSSSGNIVLICHRNGSLRCIKTETGDLLWKKKIDKIICSEYQRSRQVISQSEEYALLSWGNELIFLSMTTGEILHRMHHPAFVTETIFCKRTGFPLTAISGCVDGSLRFWNLDTGKLTREHVTKQKNCIISVALNKNSQLLALGSLNGRAVVYRFPEMDEVVSFSHPDSVMQIGFFENDNVLVTRSVTTNFWSLKEECKLLSYPQDIQMNVENSDEILWRKALGPFVLSPNGQDIVFAQLDKIKLIHGLLKNNSN